MGDQDLERQIIRAFLSARDGESQARAARDLGLMGTPRALRALAGAIRTPLVRALPMARRSVRMEALSHNLLQEPELFGCSIIDDTAYERVEQLCRRTFGTELYTPRPPFLSTQGRPHLD